MSSRQIRKYIIYGIVLSCIFIITYMYFRGNDDEEDYLEYITLKISNKNHEILPEKYKDKKLPFHQVYESRQVNFEQYKIIPINNQSRSKLLLLWTPWNGIKKTINYYSLQNGQFSFIKYGCPNVKCHVTSDRKRIRKADAILFHLLDTKLYDMPKYRHPDQRWIAYNLEAPWLIHENLTAMEGIFNWTMNYRSDSDIIVKYGFIGKTDTKYDFRAELSGRKPVIWFSSDCKTDGRREDYVKELSRHIQIDVYGKCGNKTCFPSQSEYCYQKLLKNYVFYLSFENSICKDYVTEKFFNVFNYQIIPVVFGGADYTNVAPAGSFIDTKNFPNPRDLATYMKKIMNGSTALAEYFQWKKQFKSYLYPWTCYLCDKLHEPVTSSIRHNFKKWWMDDADCHRWIPDKGFVKIE
ncbi:alpha-(1,3)-fucosyltransferase 9-like isoform X1 [Centruroides sculpturatus]|uniref:alpha-(1,3)-fucosyltransferase 9-like isoform X1 n=1 Tax=Centruroides sculpturatus TaxID=218467 RepID=UPI000C6D96D5|nr:alpha-(1,3)-fucosyltransferase 9-like isoform X1 [Centruroides sculpturatus]XP_023242266.1 alpha-(1,3)-fucosyltransferase 9-like isoform X1 [Centruroides sculpturatus]